MKNYIFSKFFIGVLSFFIFTNIFYIQKSSAQNPTKRNIQKNIKEVSEDDLRNAVRAGRPKYADAYVAVVNMLVDVKKGILTPEGFYKKVSALEMPPGKELRHVLMEVKKDIGNYLGKKGLEKVFGFIHESGGTEVEAEILTYREKVVMDTIKDAIVAYRERVKARTGEYPKFSLYYGEVGGWPKESFDELKFAGDIDFNFLSGDLDAAMEMKKIFDDMIVKKFGRTAEELDIPCTVNGMATAEVYVGKHGQSYAEEVTKTVWQIDFENAGKGMDLKAKEVSFKKALNQMVSEARSEEISNKLDDLGTLKWPTQPGISLEMIRHFEHDIVGKNVYTDLESFVKAAKYSDRSFTFLEKELKGKAVIDKRLEQFTRALTENKKNPKKQVDLINQYFDDIGKPVPFKVNLEINADGKGRATIEANEKFIKEFWDMCRKSMWDGANQVLRKRTRDLKKKIKALRKEDIQESKAIYEELVKLDEMLEIEDRILNDEVAGVHDIDPEYKKNINDFRRTRNEYKQKSAKFGHVEYIDPTIGKSYQWVETMLKMGKKSNIEWAGAALLNGVGKFNDVLDFLDDGLMTKLRTGEGQEYIKILRKGQGFYWDERANQFLKGTRFEGRFNNQFAKMGAIYDQKIGGIERQLNKNLEKMLASRGVKLIQGVASGPLKVTQTINNTFSESVAGSQLGKDVMSVMMVYSLKDELPLYYNYIGERDFSGLATEFFKRRVPFGGAVERGVMGDYYGVAWELTATLVPPVALVSAAASIGESVAMAEIDMFLTEELELFIDRLYDKAEFKIVGVETAGENIKISQWELLNVTVDSTKFNINELIAKETEDAREMGACLGKPSKELRECFPIEKVNDGLLGWKNQRAFEHKFEKTDAWIQLITEMEKNKYAGKKLKKYFQYQKYTRWAQIKVSFLKQLKVKLEERRAGEQSLISGNFPKAYEELLKIADDLDIRPQLEQEINDKFGGEVTQFMVFLKDMLRGAVRYVQGNVDVWDIYEELSAFVTKNLRIYKRIFEGRAYAEEKLVLKKHDQGLRILTGPYFLTGVAQKDAASSRQWFGYVDQITNEMKDKLTQIKKEAKEDSQELDLSTGAYDLETLNRLVYHASFKGMWKHVYGVYAKIQIPSYLGQASSKQKELNKEGVMSDQDRASLRFALHQRRIKEIMAEFKNHYDVASEEQQEEESTDSLKGLSGLLKEITALKNQIISIDTQVQGLVERIITVKNYAGEQIKKIKAQLDVIASEDEANTQSEPFDDSILSESGDIDFLAKLMATLRNTIEMETLTVCQQYEKLKVNTKIYNLEHFMDEANKAFGIVTEKYEESSKIQNKLNPTQERLKQVLKKMEISKAFVIDQGKLQEIDVSFVALKESISSIEVLFEAIKNYTKNSEALKAQAFSIIEKLKEYDPALIAQKDKAVPEKIKEINGQINTVFQKIKVRAENFDKSSVDYSQEIAGLSMHLKSLQKMARQQKTVTGRSFEESENMFKDIIAQIDAAQLFYPPIEEAHKNARICLDASQKVYDKKTSPEAQLKMADCKPFEGTIAVWSDEDQTVRCDCPKGIDWDEKKKKCVDNSPAAQLARADCRSFEGTQKEWNEVEQRVDCNCPKELEWSDKYHKCIDNSPEGQVARLDCRKYPGTYAKWDDKDKRPKCYCPDGLDWSRKYNKCIDDSPEARVDRTKCKYPYSEPHWNESKKRVECWCITDYEWNKERTACRLKRSIQVARTTCDAGLHPAWNEARQEVRCYCDDGNWDRSKGRCVSEYEQRLARQRRQRELEERERQREEERLRQREEQNRWQMEEYRKAKQSVEDMERRAREQARQSDIRYRQQQERRWQELERLKQENARRQRDKNKGKILPGFGTDWGENANKPNWDNGCNSSNTGGATYKGFLRDPPPYHGRTDFCSDRNGVTWFAGEKVLSINKGGRADQDGCYPGSSIQTTRRTYKGKICPAQ